MATVMPRFGARHRTPISARRLSSPLPPMAAQTLARAQADLARPYRGITSDRTVQGGLFPLDAAGAPTREIMAAADQLLANLESTQQQTIAFPLEDPAWQLWNNTHPFIMRHGLLLEDLDAERRERGLDLLRASLSDGGFELARNVMRLNYTIGEITQHWDEYGEWLYWLSIFGEPSLDQPWGWQIDGHHLNVNCFVLGAQLVLTPMFMGSEPTWADSGKFGGTRTFEAEEQFGLALIRSLTTEQRHTAVLTDSLLGGDGRGASEARVQGAAQRDTFVLPYAGLCTDRLAPEQQDRLLELIDVYVGRMQPAHSRVKMDEVREHLGETHILWLGGIEENSVFYYRIHSPVLLIEFDHLRGVALDNDEPARTHVHTVVRTPNGNDYGRDLLRQHHARFHTQAAPAT
jgi:hypothetical protein